MPVAFQSEDHVGHRTQVRLVRGPGRLLRSLETELDTIEQLPLPPSDRGWLAYTRGEIAQQRHPQRALSHFADAVTAARAVNNRYLEGAAIVSACSLRARAGDPGEALAAFADAVRHWNRLANTTGQLTTLRNLAVLFGRA